MVASFSNRHASLSNYLGEVNIRYWLMLFLRLRYQNAPMSQLATCNNMRCNMTGLGHHSFSSLPSSHYMYVKEA